MTWLVADRSFSSSRAVRATSADPAARNRWSIAVRYVVYSLMAVAFFAALPRLAREDSEFVFRENGPLEWLQAAMVTVACGVLAVAAVRQPERRALMTILALGLLVATVRELDRVWATSMPGLPRKAPALLGCAVFVTMAVRLRRPLLPQLMRFVGTRGFALLWMGMLITGVFAQIVGSEAFLEAVVQEDPARNFRRVVEETGEFFGYGIVLIGSVETVLKTASPERCGGTQRNRPTRRAW